VQYFERGAGKPVVFVHGLLVNAELWRSVLPGVGRGGVPLYRPGSGARRA
jgi:pimeloyl-ACP methyl ester carboxylesterase